MLVVSLHKVVVESLCPLFCKTVKFFKACQYSQNLVNVASSYIKEQEIDLYMSNLVDEELDSFLNVFICLW